MIFNVEMLAFGNGEVRPVDVPDEKLTDNVMENLELIFHYGQNDFQPLPFPSVSSGDVIHYNDKTYTVDFVGFSEIKSEVSGNKYSANRVVCKNKFFD
jgi:hypothetical protein